MQEQCKTFSSKRFLRKKFTFFTRSNYYLCAIKNMNVLGTAFTLRFFVQVCIVLKKAAFTEIVMHVLWNQGLNIRYIYFRFPYS